MRERERERERERVKTTNELSLKDEKLYLKVGFYKTFNISRVFYLLASKFCG